MPEPRTAHRPPGTPDRRSRTAAITALLGATVSLGGAAGLVASPPAPTVGSDTARAPAFGFRELAPGVIAAVVDPDVASYAFANSLLVIGEDGVLVVDTQQSPRAAKEVLEEVRRRTDLPVRWVVNTHWHADHVWGNQVYADAYPDATFISTPVTRDSVRSAWDRQIEEQRAGTVQSLERLRGMLTDTTDPERREAIEAAIDVRARYLEDVDDLRMVLADRTVTGRARLDPGGREVVLVDVGPAHTAGDLIVHLPGERITMVGDLLEEGELWLEGADIRGWVAALDTVRALGPETLIVGHGGVRTDRELLRSQRAELLALLEDG
ncbi:MAG: MBL fold metallo-hydrolase [Candidatus Longimicrobiales bacterium M2_2A_002]